MRVLVTGGGGFLGAWVMRRLLARGLGVRVFDTSAHRDIASSIAGPLSQQAEWIVGDVCRREMLDDALADCDGIIHLAGIFSNAFPGDPVKGAMVNLIGTINVFEAAKKRELSNIVYTSSVSVFGPDDAAHPNPTTHYGAFKVAAEGCARAYWEQERIASIGLRPGVIYGAGRETGISAGPTLACRAAVYGEAFEIAYSGAACLVYVDDVAAACEMALVSSPAGAQVFNLAGDAVTTDEVIAQIKVSYPGAALQAAGDPLPFPAVIDSRPLYSAFPRLRRTSFPDGIRDTIAHYEQQRGGSRQSTGRIGSVIGA